MILKVKYKRYFPFYSVFISAFLCALSFIQTLYCWWLIFVFLIPLVYGFEKMGYKYSFWHGFLWGVFFFSFHLYGLLYVVLERAEGKGALVGFICMIFYCSIYSTLWLWGMSFIPLRISFLLRILWYSFITTIFFFILSDRIFFIFGRLEGYPLFNPLLPLMEYPGVILFLPFVGYFCSLFIVFFISFSFFILLTWRDYIKIVLVILFLYSLTKITISMPLKSLSRIVSFSCANTVYVDSIERGGEILKQLLFAHEKYQGVDIIIMPESTFPFPLNKDKMLLDLISQYSFLDNKIIIIGSHRLEANKLYNSFYIIFQGRIILTYDKKHLVPFIEIVPSFWNKFNFSKGFFLTKKQEFTPSIKEHPIFSFKNFQCVPYICSELFFEEKRENCNCSVLCILNDIWFSCYYMRKLLFLNGTFKALLWEQEIIYISYFYTKYINKWGFFEDLAHF